MRPRVIATEHIRPGDVVGVAVAMGVFVAADVFVAAGVAVADWVAVAVGASTNGVGDVATTGVVCMAVAVRPLEGVWVAGMVTVMMGVGVMGPGVGVGTTNSSTGTVQATDAAVTHPETLAAFMP